MSKVTAQRHPTYDKNLSSWKKYRHVLNGGDEFIDAYLKQHSIREDPADFSIRKELTYNPGHAKAAVIDIRNSIYEQLHEIVRKSEDVTFTAAMRGLEGGVDYEGSSMTYFMGNLALTELLFLGRVGIYIDRERDLGLTKVDSTHPYFYIYSAEDILSWSKDKHGITQAILLRDKIDKINPETGLVDGIKEQFRHMRLVDGQVEYKIYELQARSQSSEPIEVVVEEGVIEIGRIPFVMIEITHSLLTDVANYQIALLNMESSDVYYAIKSNITFYVEQYDPRTDVAIKQLSDIDATTSGIPEADDKVRRTRSESSIKVGNIHGRKYPIGAERPGFVNPSPEPLKISMEKQDKMRQDIYRLVNLNLAMLETKRVSTEARKLDYHGLQTNLSYIAMELEDAEREILAIWAMYMDGVAPTVVYPENFEMKTSNDRRAEARELLETFKEVTVQSARKAILKKVVKLLLKTDIEVTELDEILKDITSMNTVLTSDELISYVENGVVSRNYVGKANNIPNSVTVEAKKEHAERLKAISDSQGGNFDGARGNKDGVQNGKDEKAQSQNSDTNPDGGKKVRK
jgi:hypothetical protein